MLDPLMLYCYICRFKTILILTLEINLEMSTMNDVRSDGQLSNIKTSLEDWREVVIKADALLGWEVDWYPAITGGVLTAAFFFIWYWDPTLLTFFAFMGLLVTLTDYLGPRIITQVTMNIKSISHCSVLVRSYLDTAK